MEKMNGDPGSIDEYIAEFPQDVQEILFKIRTVIRENAPGAVEKMSYNMPAFYLNGGLISFAVWKKHIGFYPRTAEMEASVLGLSSYKGTKGSVHFPLDKPMPYDLIGNIVRFRVEQNLKKSRPDQK